jgi:hypothetical protein
LTYVLNFLFLIKRRQINLNKNNEVLSLNIGELQQYLKKAGAFLGI